VTTVKVTDENITTAKLAIGDSVNAVLNSQDEAVSAIIDSGDGEVQQRTGTITSRGGPILINATWHGYIAIGAPFSAQIKLKRGIGGTILRTIDVTPTGLPGASQLTFTVIYVDTPGAGAVTYELTFEIVSGAAQVFRTDVSITLVDFA
jgi:hypothetical protein